MRNILILSTNAQICCQTTDILKQAGYSHIYTAADSRQAFPMIYRLNPKLIIVDLELPPDEIMNLQKTLSGPLMQITLFIAPRQHVDEAVHRPPPVPERRAGNREFPQLTSTAASQAGDAHKTNIIP